MIMKKTKNSRNVDKELKDLIENDIVAVIRKDVKNAEDRFTKHESFEDKRLFNKTQLGLC